MIVAVTAVLMTVSTWVSPVQGAPQSGGLDAQAAFGAVRESADAVADLGSGARQPARRTERATTAKDVHGTITIRATGSAASGSHYEKTFVLTFQGGIDKDVRLAPVDVTVPEFVSVAYTYNPETGNEDACLSTIFLGFRDGDVYPKGQGFVDVTAKPLDVAKKKTRGYVSVGVGYPWGTVQTAPCGETSGTPEDRPLVAAEQEPEREGLIGVGLDHKTQQVVASPGWVKFRKEDGVWRSTGRRKVADITSGIRKVVVTWDLWSKTPTNRCLIPRNDAVRGRTLTYTRNLLKGLGFPKTKVVHVSGNGVAKGRVVGITGGLFTRELACGGRVTVYVAS